MGQGGRRSYSSRACDLGLDKAHMTMVVAGHVDAGKSTLLGHLLYKAKVVNQRTIHKFSRRALS